MEQIAQVVEHLKPILPFLVKMLIELFIKKGGVTPQEQKIIDVINMLLELADDA